MEIPRVYSGARPRGEMRGGWRVSDRGRGRGNFRGRGRGAPNQPFRREEEPKPFSEDLGPPLEVLSRIQVMSVSEEDSKIRDVRYIASFNWLGSVGEPIVAIPGAPAKWTPPQPAPKLRFDSGTYYRENNTAFSPKYHMHATALAILEAKTIDTDDADIVACAGSLRMLLEFLRGESKMFRIAVELVGETVFFVRRQTNPRASYESLWGYGHSMPEAYTTWHPTVKGSVSAQRVVGYRFGGMQCLVRFEADGYLPEHAGDCETAAVGEVGQASDDIADILGGTNISSALGAAEDTAELQEKKAGFVAPQQAIFELKTRAAGHEHKLFEEFAPSLWLKQIPFFINAYHERGSFNDIQIVDVHEQVEEWENSNRDLLRKLGGLLRWIVARVRASPDHKLELFRSGSGPLAVHAPGGSYEGALPIDVEDRWNHLDDDSGGSSDDA